METLYNNMLLIYLLIISGTSHKSWRQVPIFKLCTKLLETLKKSRKFTQSKILEKSSPNLVQSSTFVHLSKHVCGSKSRNELNPKENCSHEITEKWRHFIDIVTFIHTKTGGQLICLLHNVPKVSNRISMSLIQELPDLVKVVT